MEWFAGSTLKECFEFDHVPEKLSPCGAANISVLIGFDFWLQPRGLSSNLAMCWPFLSYPSTLLKMCHYSGSYRRCAITDFPCKHSGLAACCKSSSVSKFAKKLSLRTIYNFRELDGKGCYLVTESCGFDSSSHRFFFCLSNCSAPSHSASVKEALGWWMKERKTVSGWVPKWLHSCCPKGYGKMDKALAYCKVNPGSSPTTS